MAIAKFGRTDRGLSTMPSKNPLYIPRSNFKYNDRHSFFVVSLRETTLSKLKLTLRAFPARQSPVQDDSTSNHSFPRSSTCLLHDISASTSFSYHSHASCLTSGFSENCVRWPLPA